MASVQWSEAVRVRGARAPGGGTVVARLIDCPDGCGAGGGGGAVGGGSVGWVGGWVGGEGGAAGGLAVALLTRTCVPVLCDLTMFLFVLGRVGGGWTKLAASWVTGVSPHQPPAL